jgi:hypothetical protein
VPARDPASGGHRRGVVEELPSPGRQRAVLLLGGLVAGHQLCSDLAILAAGAAVPPPAVAAASAAWRQRRQETSGLSRFLDTRYDAGHILTGQSHRLVDVCADLRLDVTQPELRALP